MTARAFEGGAFRTTDPLFEYHDNNALFSSFVCTWGQLVGLLIRWIVIYVDDVCARSLWRWSVLCNWWMFCVCLLYKMRVLSAPIEEYWMGNNRMLEINFDSIIWWADNSNLLMIRFATLPHRQSIKLTYCWTSVLID